MCNFCCVQWKEYFKETVYKILFCVKEAIVFSFLGHLCWRMWEESSWVFRACRCPYTDPIVPPPSLKRCRALSSVWGSAASQAWNQVALALRSPWWHWNDQVKATGIWFFPLVKGGSFGGLLKMDQRRFFTAPRTPLLCLVVTQRQMVFLSFCKWSFWKNVLETGLLRWIWTLKILLYKYCDVLQSNLILLFLKTV